MTHVARLLFAAVGILMVTSSMAGAQAIVGTVRDESGGILPGVTVEAGSPALIEKVRSATTDGSGQYRIVNLSPGVYSVTFTLPGFSVVRREGIELSGNFTATVNTDMKVGALEETITVSGAAPLVDVQSLTRQTVLTRDVLDVLPAARNIQSAGVMIPGVTTAGVAGQTGRDVGGTTKLQQPSIVFRGTGQNVQRWDGFHLGNLAGANTGAGTSFYVNDVAAQELVYSSGAESAEMGHPGLYIDLVPKDGGNRFAGTIFGDFTHSPWSWSNYSPKLSARGISDVTKVYHISDFNVGVGGPIQKDRVWFYSAYRYEALDVSVVDNFYDKNPAPHLYEPDLTRPAHDSGYIPNQSVRLTWQASQKDKVQFWFTNQNKAREFYNISASITPDGAGRQSTRHAQPITTKWTRTQTSRLLFEGGVAIGRTFFDNGYRETVTPSFDRVVIQNTPIYAITDIANNKSFGASVAGYMAFGGVMKVGRVAGTYVTGSHALKAGVEASSGQGPNGAWNWFTGDVTLTYNNGVPQGVTLRIPRQQSDGYSDLQLFVQDRWTIRRATITSGLRYDYFVGRVNDSTLPPSRWNAEQFFPGFEVQHWKDVSPRLGIAYDLFGDGKTALKASIARYVAPESNGTSQANNPQTTIGRTDARTWRDLNGDFSIYNVDGSVQWEELGPTSNANFGRSIPTTATRDPRTLEGWSARGATVEWQVIAQHELTSRVGVHGGYYLRYLGNQTAIDNTLVTAADFTGPFCISTPAHQDLPGGGGYPLCGLYDITPAARGRVQNHTTFARDFGGIVDRYQGVDLGMSARFGGEAFVNGGINMQRRLLDTCRTDTIDSPEAQFCRTVTPYRPDFKLSGLYTLPWALQISGLYQVSPGPQITATWNAPNALIAPALGRNLSAGATATKSVQLIQPGTLYGDAHTQLDVRLSRRFRLGRFRVRADANLYNVFNNDWVSAVNTTFSTTASNAFMRPTGVLQGRLFKIGGQLDF
jgi:hypothetical protein